MWVAGKMGKNGDLRVRPVAVMAGWDEHRWPDDPTGWPVRRAQVAGRSGRLAGWVERKWPNVVG
jgi:hypothetical protein